MATMARGPAQPCFLLLSVCLLQVVTIRGGARCLPATALIGKRGISFGVLQQTQRRPPLNLHNLSLLARLRAGSQDEEEEDSDEEDDGDDAGGVKEMDGDEEEEDDESEDDDDEDEKENDSETTKAESKRLETPVPVVIHVKFGRQSSILDQKIDLTQQRRRSIAELKKNIRRSLPNKPPTSLMQIIHDGRILKDETLIDEIMLDEEDDEDDDEEDDDNEDGDGKGALHLSLDMVPPVEPKFMQTLPEQLKDLTTSELLRLYANNEAALHETDMSLLSSFKGNDPDEDDDDENDREAPIPRQIIPLIEERSDRIEGQLRSMLLQQEQAASILEETRPPSAIQAATEIRGERVREAIPSRGVKTSLRRKLQHTFNVSWAETIRSICLFIFFGLFGGRTPMSRLILLVGAPSVLVLQARPVKLLWKQALYWAMNDPPPIVLSLLPAPQQALFHFDEEQAMQTIYGPYTTETRTRKKDGLEAAEEEFFDAEEEEFFDAKEDEEEEDDEDEDDEEEEEEGEDDEEDEDEDDDDDEDY